VRKKLVGLLGSFLKRAKVRKKLLFLRSFSKKIRAKVRKKFILHTFFVRRYASNVAMAAPKPGKV